MNRRWEASDPYYDARASGSHKLNDHLKELADKSIRDIDNDYLDFHRLLMGQSPQHKRHSLRDKQSGEQQTAVISSDRNGSENVEDRQARTVENGLELRDCLPDDLGLGEAVRRPARRMNVRPRNGSREDDDAVRLPKCPRRSSELQNGTETIQRKLCKASDGHNKVGVENLLESFERSYVEVKQLKKMVVKLENTMKEDRKKLRLYLKGTSEDCSTAEDRDNGSDDVEVLNQVAVMEQQTPTDEHLAITAADDAATVEFRRRVLSDLNKPFDKDEYARLSKQFNGARRRSYPDVQKILSEHRYKTEKRLKVLRGFFFWFENYAQIGSFEPWKDSECLAVL